MLLVENWELGIGNWELGIGNWEFASLPPHLPISPSPHPSWERAHVGGGRTSVEGARQCAPTV
ncbi:MAG: hypothetical protein F6K47_27475 [Symploca sp. SIO2E6]|nr:hypothetical protein [Symploca sp. SIO2E6]